MSMSQSSCIVICTVTFCCALVIASANMFGQPAAQNNRQVVQDMTIVDERGNVRWQIAVQNDVAVLRGYNKRGHQFFSVYEIGDGAAAAFTNDGGMPVIVFSSEPEASIGMASTKDGIDSELSVSLLPESQGIKIKCPLTDISHDLKLFPPQGVLKNK